MPYPALSVQHSKAFETNYIGTVSISCTLELSKEILQGPNTKCTIYKVLPKNTGLLPKFRQVGDEKEILTFATLVKGKE